MSDQSTQFDLTHAQADELRRRWRLMRLWDDTRADTQWRGESLKTAADRLLRSLVAAGEPTVSRGTLYAWHRDWRANGLRGLLDCRWRCSRELLPAAGKDASPFMARLAQAHAGETKRHSTEFYYQVAADAFDRPDERCTLRQAKRFIKRCQLHELATKGEG